MYIFLINLQITPFGNAGKSQILYNVSMYTPCNIILNVAAPIFKCEQNDASCISGSHHFTVLQKTKQNKQKLLPPYGENKTLSAESETLHSSLNALNLSFKKSNCT